MKYYIILVFFGTRMQQDYQDDSSFSSWYPIKYTDREIYKKIRLGLSGGGCTLPRTPTLQLGERLPPLLPKLLLILKKKNEGNIKDRQTDRRQVPGSL